MVERKNQSRGLGRGLGSLIPALTTPPVEPDAKVARPSEDATPASYRTGRQGIDTFFPQGDERPKRRASDLASSLAGDMRASRAGTKATSAAKPAKATEAAAPSTDKVATKSSRAKGASPTKSREAPAVDAPQPADPKVVDSVPVEPAVAEMVKPENAVVSAQGSDAEPHGDVSRETGVDPQPESATATSVVAEEVQGLAVETGAPTVVENPQPVEDKTETDAAALLPVPGAAFADLPVNSIRPNPRQPREVFDEEALDELVFSVREIGVLQPIVVRPIPEPLLDSVPDGLQYEIIMGERRWRASKLADKEFVPAIIRTTSDDDLLRDALLENLHRAQLNPLEEAAAYSQLLEDFGCTQEELASRIGRSRPQISNMIRLMKLPPLVQRRVAAGVLSMGHARALLGLKDNAAIERLAQKVVAEGLSVRATEELVALGDNQAPDLPAHRIGRTINPVMDDIAGRLSDRFDTRVKIAMGTRRGKLTVEFSGMDDLQRILEVIAPGAEVDE
ncbi:ParB/RepB/Spo0J family partition protein [Micrococcales bacterium 31B]|nr:ParB/RepB/Spo0J family partition protein [Micrococcales bacterium 31B]